MKAVSSQPIISDEENALMVTKGDFVIASTRQAFD